MVPSMDSPGSMKKVMRSGMLMLKRDKSWKGALLLLASVLLIVQCSVIGLLALGSARQMVLSQTGLRLDVLTGASDQDVQDFFAAAHSDPSVQSISLITKDQAFATAQKSNPALVDFITRYNISNPFHDTFAITLVSSTSADDFKQFVSQERWKSVIDPAFLVNAETLAAQSRVVGSALAAIRFGLIFVLIVSSLALFFAMLERMRERLHAQSAGVFLQTMIGASAMGILLPSVAETAILLIGGLIVSTVLSVGLVALVPVMIPDMAVGLNEFLALLHWSLAWVFPWIVVLELCVLPAASYAAALLMSMRKALHS